MVSLKAYLELVKPRQTIAIFALFLLSIIAGSKEKIFLWDLGNILNSILGGIAVITCVAGSNALNNYLDRDIDSKMARTMRRPIPSGRVKDRNAFWLSMLLIGVSVYFARLLGTFVILLLGGIGILSYLILYTVLLKRRSSLNVFATAPAIASPVWVGWILGNGSLDTEGFLLGLLVMVWGPLHLWSLAAAFAKDYEKAGVPMLPTKMSHSRASWHIMILSLVLVFSSYLLYLLGDLGWLYLLGISFLNLILVILSVRIIFDPQGKMCWYLYKFTAPYMVLVLFMVTLDPLVIL